MPRDRARLTNPFAHGYAVEPKIDTYHFPKPKSGWNLQHCIDAVEYGGDPFEMWVLQFVDEGKQHCHCCGKLFKSHDEVDMISVQLRTNPNAMKIDAYHAKCIAIWGLDFLDDVARDFYDNSF